MTFLQHLKERRARNRDISLLWGQVHDLFDLLTEARSERDFWQEEAISAQLEADQLKRSRT